MKKLMIAAFAVAFAAVAQAAAVAWNSGSFSNGFADPEGATLKSSTAYTMVVTFFSDVEGLVVLGSDSKNKGSAIGAYSNTFSGFDFSAGNTYYAKAIITANADESIKLESEIVAFITPADNSNAAINFQTGAGLVSGEKAWGEWQTATIPEPTSALMLLVGLAGLALKRKVA